MFAPRSRAVKKPYGASLSLFLAIHVNLVQNFLIPVTNKKKITLTLDLNPPYDLAPQSNFP